MRIGDNLAGFVIALPQHLDARVGLQHRAELRRLLLGLSQRRGSLRAGCLQLAQVHPLTGVAEPCGVCEQLIAALDQRVEVLPLCGALWRVTRQEPAGRITSRHFRRKRLLTHA